MIRILTTTLTINLLSCLSLCHANLLITEVKFNGHPDWVEIYNSGPAAINLASFILTDLDGTDSPLATGPATLDSTHYALIHWQEGEDETDNNGDYNDNGILDLYTDDTGLTATDDQAVLFISGSFVDAVCWANLDSTISEYKDVNLLSEEGQWDFAGTNGELFPAVCWVSSTTLTENSSLARFRKTDGSGYLDSNTFSDWYQTEVPSPGTSNNIVCEPFSLSLCLFGLFTFVLKSRII